MLKQTTKSLLISISLVLPLSLYAVTDSHGHEDCNTTHEIVAPTPTMATIEKGYELLESMKLKDNYEAIIQRITDMQIKNNPTLKESRPKIEAFFDKSMGWETIKEDMANLYIKHYTAKEIEELNTFYQTPTGQKSIAIMPQLASTGGIIQQNKMMTNMKALQDMIKEELKNHNSKQLNMSSPFNIK